MPLPMPCTSSAKSCPKEVLAKIFDYDETSVHHVQTTIKTVEAFVITPRPKKAKTVPSIVKVMASCFWGAESVIKVD